MYALFPRLQERAGQLAGTLSGGEQQMVAVGRALMACPSVLVVDEPSLGLAPLIVREIFRIIAELRSRNCAILLVDQGVGQADHAAHARRETGGGEVAAQALEQLRGGAGAGVVEDDGVGEDPAKVRRALAGDVSVDSVGLGNVDARLRTAFGDDYGLVVETAPGAGTKVVVRVPKFAPGVRP